MTTIDERVRDLEVTMWGARGDNGLRSEIRQLKQTVEDLPDKVRKEIDEAVASIEGRDERGRAQRWVMIGLGLTCTVTFIGALIEALATVLH